MQLCSFCSSLPSICRRPHRHLEEQNHPVPEKSRNFRYRKNVTDRWEGKVAGLSPSAQELKHVLRRQETSTLGPFTKRAWTSPGSQQSGLTTTLQTRNCLQLSSWSSPLGSQEGKIHVARWRWTSETDADLGMGPVLCLFIQCILNARSSGPPSKGGLGKKLENAQCVACWLQYCT